MNAFIIKDGPEIRTYSSPPYSIDLQQSIVFYLNKHDSLHLKEYQAKFAFKIININNHISRTKRPFFRLIEILFSGAKKRYRTFSGEKEYSHVARKQNDVSENSLLRTLLYFPFFILSRLYDFLSLKKTLHIQELEHCVGIQTLYIAAYNKHYLNIILNIKEKNPDVKIVFILHSEKDLYVDSYIPNICDELHLWQESNLSYIKKTYPFFRGEVKLMGVPRFKRLNHYINNHNNKCSKDIYTIMYICAHSYIVNDEFKLIQELIKSTNSLDRQANWVIRLNPMNQEVLAFEALCSEHVSISYPDWEWNEDKFFNMPSYQSEEEFYDLIQRSDIFVGSISTVALEACVAKKKYIALTFDNDGESMKLNRLLNSQIYDRYREYGQIRICSTKEEFEVQLMEELTNPVRDDFFEPLRKELLGYE